MKKIIYGLLILVLVISPINVFAETSGSVTVASNELTVGINKVETFTIDVYNALARANIKSSDESVAVLVDDSGNPIKMENWVSKVGGEGTTLSHDIYVKGLKEGVATITINVFDASSYAIEKLTIEDITIKVNVTAEAEVTKYTVTYDANEGKNAPSKQEGTVGTELTLSTTKPVRDGYEFLGWNTSKDGNGDSYSAGGKYTKGKTVTLYAQWKQTENVNKNPQTGDTLIYVVLLLTLGALIYSYWYMNKTKEN